MIVCSEYVAWQDLLEAVAGYAADHGLHIHMQNSASSIWISCTLGGKGVPMIQVTISNFSHSCGGRILITCSTLTLDW